MNILFFLTPKRDVAFLYEDQNLQEALLQMEQKKYSCIPVLTREGSYAGTLSEGDLLWAIARARREGRDIDLSLPVFGIMRRSTYRPVRVSSNMEDLLDRAINQNFVPVVDDQNAFIGIVTRKEIIRYGYERLKKLDALEGKDPV